MKEGVYKKEGCPLFSGGRPSVFLANSVGTRGEMPIRTILAKSSLRAIITAIFQISRSASLGMGILFEN